MVAYIPVCMSVVINTPMVAYIIAVHVYEGINTPMVAYIIAVCVIT
jgi:hypothetical protein